MGISKTSDHIQIKIKMRNPSQKPPVSSNTQNQDLKDMDVFCAFKIKIKSQNSDHVCITRWRTKILNMGVSKISYHMQIKMKMPNPSQEPVASFKALNKNLKDMDVLCAFKI